MANRLISGNVIIVDSAMGNLGIFMGTGNMTNVDVAGFAFKTANTGGVCIFTGANTTDVITYFDIVAHVGSGGLISNPLTHSFTYPIRLNISTELKIPTLLNGTAWVYLR